MIHGGSCRNCNEERGCHENPLGNRNGKWHGPFDSLEDAKKQQQIQAGRFDNIAAYERFANFS